MLRNASGLGLLGALMLVISGCVVVDDRGHGGRGYYGGQYHHHHGHRHWR